LACCAVLPRLARPSEPAQAAAQWRLASKR
jgi:hypothetical protein